VRAEHFAVASDESPVAKPECLECGASFIEKDDGVFLHCFSTRHISIERHPRPTIPPARVAARVYLDAREPLGFGRNYLYGRGECHGEAYDTETVGAKCRRRSVCDANECGGDLRRCSPSRGLNWPVAARPVLRPARPSWHRRPLLRSSPSSVPLTAITTRSRSFGTFARVSC
jgi:hypothetical protein